MTKVLVIDDEAPIRLLCRVNLEAEGMEVIEAPDGPSGVDKARDERPDVILLEIASLPERFESLQSMIRSSSRTDDVGVVGFSDGKSSPLRETFFARDLDQLKVLICRQLKPSSAYHVQRG